MAVLEMEVRGPIRHVRLNRPEKRNALNPEMIRLLKEAFATPPGPDERLALVEAEGPVFCAGIDLKERDGSAAGIKPFEEALHAMETFPLPVGSAAGIQAVSAIIQPRRGICFFGKENGDDRVGKSEKHRSAKDPERW